MKANSQYGATDVRNQSTISTNSSEEDTSKDKPTEEHPNNVGSTFALCLCALTHAYLNVSVYPYAGFMAIELIPGVDEETAGSYAGLIASMFMAGRFLSSYAWGQIADTYGRTFCLYASLLWIAIFALLFGMASTFHMALFWRFCLGLGNGLVGTAKTCVSELAKGNSKRETTAMGWLIAMWGLAGLIGPALGGLLAEPIDQYPEFWNSVEGNSWRAIRDFLTLKKFVLPNLVGTILCLYAILAIRIFVKETLAEDQRRPIHCIPKDIAQKCSNICSYCKGNNNNTAQECLPLNNGGDKGITTERATIASLWARPNTRQCLLVYWGGSFLGIASDEIFPLFCISKKAGLALEERGIGEILAFGALFFFLLQYPIYSNLVSKHGVIPSMRIGLFVSLLICLLLPSIRLVADHGAMWRTLAYSTFLLAFYRIFGLIFFSTIQVALNRTVPDNQRATLNGLDMMGNSAVKSIGPYLAGCLFSFSVSSGVFPPGVGVVVPFAVVAAFGFLLLWFTYFLSPEESNDAERNDSE